MFLAENFWMSPITVPLHADAQSRYAVERGNIANIEPVESEYYAWHQHPGQVDPMEDSNGEYGGKL
jgi:hypothetical protein